ncbi:MAG TPA: hypothetical protein VK843_13840 [Planctomycetota bacterium]|nr:hypothetical protein [Planctomycetota bacterium]
MSVVLLPRAGDPDGIALAQAKLSACIEDPFSAVMIVSGESPDIDSVIEVGSARASLDPLRRTVVWVRDLDVLTAEQKADYAADGTVAAFVALNDKVAVRLKLVKAREKFWVEKAFTDAGG